VEADLGVVSPIRGHAGRVIRGYQTIFSLTCRRNMVYLLV
jgi:hypothetical protein